MKKLVPCNVSQRNVSYVTQQVRSHKTKKGKKRQTAHFGLEALKTDLLNINSSPLFHSNTYGS